MSLLKLSFSDISQQELRNIFNQLSTAMINQKDFIEKFGQSRVISCEEGSPHSTMILETTSNKTNELQNYVTEWIEDKTGKYLYENQTLDFE